MMLLNACYSYQLPCDHGWIHLHSLVTNVWWSHAFRKPGQAIIGMVWDKGFQNDSISLYSISMCFAQCFFFSLLHAQLWLPSRRTSVTVTTPPKKEYSSFPCWTRTCLWNEPQNWNTHEKGKKKRWKRIITTNTEWMSTPWGRVKV